MTKTLDKNVEGEKKYNSAMNNIGKYVAMAGLAGALTLGSGCAIIAGDVGKFIGGYAGNKSNLPTVKQVKKFKKIGERRYYDSKTNYTYIIYKYENGEEQVGKLLIPGKMTAKEYQEKRDIWMKELE